MTNEEKYYQETRKANALIVAGELAGLSMHLDTEALAKFVENPPADFRYTALSKAAIVFAQAVRSR